MKRFLKQLFTVILFLSWGFTQVSARDVAGAEHTAAGKADITWTDADHEFIFATGFVFVEEDDDRLLHKKQSPDLWLAAYIITPDTAAVRPVVKVSRDAFFISASRRTYLLNQVFII